MLIKSSFKTFLSKLPSKLKLKSKGNKNFSYKKNKTKFNSAFSKRYYSYSKNFSKFKNYKKFSKKNKYKSKLKKFKIFKRKLINYYFYKLRLALKPVRRVKPVTFMKNKSLNVVISKRDYTTFVKPNNPMMHYLIDIGLKFFLHKFPLDSLKLYFLNYSNIKYLNNKIYNYYLFYFSCYFFSSNVLMLKNYFLVFFSFSLLLFHDFSLIVTLLWIYI